MMDGIFREGLLPPTFSLPENSPQDGHKWSAPLQSSSVTLRGVQTLVSKLFSEQAALVFDI